MMNAKDKKIILGKEKRRIEKISRNNVLKHLLTAPLGKVNKLEK